MGRETDLGEGRLTNTKRGRSRRRDAQRLFPRLLGSQLFTERPRAAAGIETQKSIKSAMVALFPGERKDGLVSRGGLDAQSPTGPEWRERPRCWGRCRHSTAILGGTASSRAKRKARPGATAPRRRRSRAVAAANLSAFLQPHNGEVGIHRTSAPERDPQPQRQHHQILRSP
jgi:hypothetical protein